MTVVRNAQELLEDLENCRKKVQVSKNYYLKIKTGKIKSCLSMTQVDIDLSHFNGQIYAYDQAIELAKSLISKGEK